MDQVTPGGKKYNLKYLIGVVVTATLSCFVTGYEMGVFNTCQRNVAHTLNWGDKTDTYISINNAVMPIGGILGSLLAGPISNKLGRKIANVITAFTFIVACGLNVVPHISAFCIARFISGIGSGLALSICPIFSNLYLVAELAPIEISGILGSFVQLQITLGIFISYSMGTPLPISDLSSSMNDWWIVMFLLPIPISILQILLICFAYPVETPKWLVHKGRTEQASKVLERVYINNEPTSQVKLININEAEAEENPSESSYQPSYKDLLCSSYLKITLIGCCNLHIRSMSSRSAHRY